MNAVLLCAHGAPGSLDEVEPFLSRVRRGRPTPPEVVAEVKRRYAIIGGRSPLVEVTRAQAAALAERLAGLATVHVGMRHSSPSISDAVAAARAAGAERILAILLIPQASRLVAGPYARALEEALGHPADLAPSYCDHPRLAEAFAARVREALELMPSDADPTLLFTVHSLPESAAAGDSYPEEFRRTAEAVLRALGAGAPRHRLAYQSQGMTEEAWLGPSVPEALSALQAEGRRDVLLAPVGFVADNVEILYDVDVDYRGRAEALGLRFWRTRSLNDSPPFIDVLEELAREGLE
jgi:ferrochelatase